MKIRNPLLSRASGWLAAMALRCWMSTLDYRVAYYDPTTDPAHPDFDGNKIYIFWHEYIPLPLYLRGHCNVTMLISQHGDADVLDWAAHDLGFELVRGSSYRGGAAALRGLCDHGRRMNLSMTPDGPRGPRRRLAAGPIYLASKLDMPLVAMGFGYERPWRLRSWDRFAIPRPYSRTRAVVSPPLRMPAGLDRDGIEHYRLEVERMLNRMTLEAEAWAEAGTHKLSEHSLRSKRLSRRLRVGEPRGLSRGPEPGR